MTVQDRTRQDRTGSSGLTRTPVVPTRVTAGQVQVARFRVLRDQQSGRATPEAIARIASVVLPGDPVTS